MGTIGTLKRVYGDKWINRIENIAFIAGIVLIFYIVNLKLSNLGLQMFIDAQKSRTEISVIKKQQRETEAMFESL